MKRILIYKENKDKDSIFEMKERRSTSSPREEEKVTPNEFKPNKNGKRKKKKKECVHYKETGNFDRNCFPVLV